MRHSAKVIHYSWCIAPLAVNNIVSNRSIFQTFVCTYRLWSAQPRNPHSGRPPHRGAQVPMGSETHVRKPFPLRRITYQQRLRADRSSLRPEVSAYYLLSILYVFKMV